MKLEGTSLGGLDKDFGFILRVMGSCWESQEGASYGIGHYILK